jgi:hypothetical protein
VIESQDQPLEEEGASPDAAPVERVPLGRLLVDAGFLTRPQLDDCLAEGSKTGERIGEVVVRRGLASEDDVARLLAEQWGLEYVERSAIWFDGNALGKLSREDAQRWEALPTRVEGGHVVVAVAEPTEQRIAAVRELIGGETVLIVVPKSALDAGLRSQLLASRGGQFEAGAPDLDEPVDRDGAGADEDPDLAQLDEDAGGAESDGPPAPPKLTPVPPLPELDFDPEPRKEPEPEPERKSKSKSSSRPPAASVELSGDDEAEAEAVQALAAEAQAVAERLAAQAATVRQRAHAQNELRAQTEAYEERLTALEQELDTRKAQLEALRNQLRSALDLAAE